MWIHVRLCLLALGLSPTTGLSWQSNNTYVGQGCQANQLATLRVTLRNQQFQNQSTCRGNGNTSECVAIGGFTPGCPVPAVSDTTPYTFTLQYPESNCTISAGSVEVATLTVAPLSASPAPNCTAFVASHTTAQAFGCANVGALSFRYACGAFAPTMATLRLYETDLPSPVGSAPPTPASAPTSAADTTQAPTSAGSNSLVRTTTHGPVRGQQLSPTVKGWYGVRFAAEPVLGLRWRPPQPPTPWSTVVNATVHQSCLQISDAGAIGTEAGCLTVDVWAPNTAVPNGTSYPVMLWIHGGGFTDFGPPFPTETATHVVEESIRMGTPVVAVSVNYRLAGLGFMGSALLAAENNTHGSSGNYGMLDQIAAMEWVRDNARFFGGSGSDVTIYGESAGAYSVCAHLASPLSQGLFSAAILESAYCGLAYVYNSVSAQVGTSCMALHGCSTIECMRTIPAEAALNCTFADLQHAGQITTRPGASQIISQELPNIDGYVLTEPPLDYIREHNTVPVMVGSNEYEMMVFAFRAAAERAGFAWNMTERGLDDYAFAFIDSLGYRRFSDSARPPSFATPSLVSELLSYYPAEEYTQYAAAVRALFATNLCHTAPGLPCNFTTSVARAVAVVTDALFTFTTAAIADAVTVSGQPAFRYLFKQNMSGLVTPNNQSYNLFGPAGAFHSLDVAFVFGTFAEYARPFGLGWTPTADQQTLSTQMQRYWINFAVHGNPNGNTSSGGGGGATSSPPLPTWPLWTSRDMSEPGGQYIELVQPGIGQGSGFHADALAYLETLSEVAAEVSATGSAARAEATVALQTHADRIIARNATEIALQYTPNAELATFNTATQTSMVYRGRAQIQVFWANLLSNYNLLDCGADDGALLFLIRPDSFFLSWPCDGCGVRVGTDAVLLNASAGYALQQHNVVLDWPGVNLSSWAAANTSAVPCRPQSAAAPLALPAGVAVPSGPVATAVAQTFAANLLARNASAVVAAYAPAAEVAVFNLATRTGRVFRGQAQIAQFVAALLATVNFTQCTEAPFLTQVQTRSFFIVWPCVSCGIAVGSDSVMLGLSNSSIVQHSVVVDWAGVNMSGTVWTAAAGATPCRTGSPATAAPASSAPTSNSPAPTSAAPSRVSGSPTMSSAPTRISAAPSRFTTVPTRVSRAPSRVPTRHPTAGPSAPPSQAGGSSSAKKLSDGDYSGIVIGALVVGLVILMGLAFACQNKSSRSSTGYSEVPTDRARENPAYNAYDYASSA
eukprot:m.217368 g.217368  ORF g.217368 m.217368 type:complete len:1243 (+) comp15557_c1_seq1:32-3760(+)